MLIRVLFIIFILKSFLFSYSTTDKNVEILAKVVDKNSTLIHAKGDVVLYSDRYIITADEAFYDYNSSDLELFGNITIMEGVQFSSRSGYAKLNLKNEIGKLTPMFAYAQKGQVWLKCDSAFFNPKAYITKKTVVSSCNVQNPDWKITFSSGKFDKKNKFLTTYNSLFYLKKIPIFYLPYFSFSTDKTRRTGLLTPEFSYSNDEGLYYVQPIFIAPKESWDFEIKPQVRTKRGSGVNNTLRYVDSPDSYGEVTFGYFKERKDYFEKNNLKNRQHWGYSIKYDRGELISHLLNKYSEDGFWLDFNYLNDIDYLNTRDSSKRVYDKLVQSTLNYYLKQDLDYIGFYAKFYIDTSKVNNEDTVQELPTIQYHRFTNRIIHDKLFYSADYKMTNLTSKKGFNAVYHQLNIPISLHFTLLNEYIKFKLSENFYISEVNYTDKKVYETGNGNILQNYHSVQIYTELVKRYANFLHTLYFGIDYTHPGYSKKSDGFKYIEQSEDLDELKSISNNIKENLSLSLVEFFYNKNGKKLISHSLRQSIILGNLDSDEYRYRDLENNIKIYLNNVTIKNTLLLSYEYARISKFQTSVDWKIDDYKFDFIHTYQIKREDNIDLRDNYLTFNAKTSYVKNYNFFTSLNYDMEDNYFKSWSIGWTMKKKCWDYKLTYKEDRTPKLTSAGSDSTNIRSVYLTFNLYPIGGVSYDFTKETKAVE